MLCPGLAPAIQYPPGQKEQKKKVFEQEMIVELVQGLPPFGAFDICLLPHLENHLPFDRKNFSHKTRYTFRLEKQVSAETTFQEFSSSLRSQIRKAEKLVTISKSEDVQLLFKMSTCTFTRQGKKNPFSLRYLKQIYEACAQNNCGKILVASDQNKQVHAAIYIVWDTHCVYYLLGGGDEHFRSSGSYSLLLWKGIQWALKQNATFDFCGSMLPQVERFFRGFGGLQVPYFQITKFSPALKILLPVWKTLKGSI